MSKELLKCNDNISFVFRENLVNKELLVLLVTVDLPDLWDPLDSVDLLERLEERSELHNNNNNKMLLVKTSVVHYVYGYTILYYITILTYTQGKKDCQLDQSNQIHAISLKNMFFCISGYPWIRWTSW